MAGAPTRSQGEPTHQTLVSLSGPFEFGNITSIAADSTRLFVADGMHRAVFVLDRETQERVATIGGPGAGPGEFRYPVAVGFRGDTVMVFDETASRLSYFGKDGALLGTANVAPQPRYGQKGEALVVGGILFSLDYGEFQDGLLHNLGARARGLTRGWNHVARWDALAGEWARIARVDGVEVYADVGNNTLVDVAFPRGPLWTPSFDGSGVWVADSGEPLVRHFRLSSDVEDRSLDSGFRTFPVPPVAKAAYLNADDQQGRGEERIVRARQTRAGLPFPEDMPPLIGLLSAPGERLWVVGRTGDSVVLRLIDRDGNRLSDVLVPEGFTPMLAEPHQVIGILRDSLGVQSVAALPAFQASSR